MPPLGPLHAVCCPAPPPSPALPPHSPFLSAHSASPRRSLPVVAVGALQRGRGAAHGGVGLRGGEVGRAQAEVVRAVDDSEEIGDGGMRSAGWGSESDSDQAAGRMVEESREARTPGSSQHPLHQPSQGAASPSLAQRLLSVRRASQAHSEARGKGGGGGGSTSSESSEGGGRAGDMGSGTDQPSHSQLPPPSPSPLPSPLLLTTASGGAAALNRRLVAATCLADVMQVVANEMARLPPRPEWSAPGAEKGKGGVDGKVRGGGKGGRRSRARAHREGHGGWGAGGKGKEEGEGLGEEEREWEKWEEERRAMERKWESAAACALFSPINAVTALHRIARHMQAEGVSPSSRLALALSPPLRLLVAAALPAVRAAHCNAQTLSNLAWALARIGGTGGGAGDMAGGGKAQGEVGGGGGGGRTWVYSEEFDLIAAAVLRVQHSLTSQHVANVAAAFALARHLPPSALLPALALQACCALPPPRPHSRAPLPRPPCAVCCPPTSCRSCCGPSPRSTTRCPPPSPTPSTAPPPPSPHPRSPAPTTSCT
ncbi:hypothetical protein CLOM_g11748 [Closterium sp. NIES-68]|nr:hypothetical protein CLOM_g11748 [Closterium sp. NIES-68]